MIKKLISCLTLICMICVLLTSCASGERLYVNGTKIDSETVAYFKLTAKEGEDYKQSVARYVAINSEFENKELTISPSEKATLTENVNNLWHTYKDFYSKNGISKETLYKINLSKLYEDILLENYYGKDGANPISEDAIKAYFRENFASIRFVTGYLFELSQNGTLALTEAQQEKIVSSFNNAATTINGGTSLEEAISLLGSPEIHSAVISKAEKSNFPEGFFEAIKGIETDKASAVVLGSYVFLVEKENSESGEFECYSQYRSQCLKQMKGEEFNKIIDNLAKNYSVK